MKQPTVYIMANKKNGAIYIGVTSNLIKRVYEHKNLPIKNSFTSKYNCKMLVYYALCDTMDIALTQEKRLKGYLRSKKLKLIENSNPEWVDLYDSICH